MSDETIHARQGQPRHSGLVLFSLSRPLVAAGWLFLLVLTLAGCSTGQVRYAEGKRDGPVVILGDSLAAGYGVEKDQGFVALLEARLGISIVNLGKSGATTTDSTARVGKEVLPLKPSLVLLELGGNDALQKLDPAKTRANLSAMIAELHAAGIPVIVLGVRGGLMSDKYSGMFEDLVQEHQTGYVADLLEGILTHPELKIDSIHPNALGHQRLADKVEPELRRVWESIGGKP